MPTRNCPNVFGTAVNFPVRESILNGTPPELPFNKSSNEYGLLQVIESKGGLSGYP